MCFFGSLYYNKGLRDNLQSSQIGRIIECMYVFFPYVAIRLWFPITRFKNAGKKNYRTKRNERFYEVGTKMIKIFYLWAKYFLGFHINFMVFLDLVKPENRKFVDGLFLLNVGTVSIAIFLHTLRFKKLLPPRLTFSLYICQIYA